MRNQHLKVLIYVELASKLGSIRKAAEQLNIASTAVNRSIIAMERNLETQLFERLPHGVRLTAAGELFVAHSRATIVDFERLQSEIDALRGLRRGHVTIAAIEAVAPALLPDIIADYQKSHPRVQFTVRIGATDQIIAALQADEVDLAFVHNFSANPDISVVAQVRQPLFALMAHSHPLAERKSLRLHECINYPIVFAEGSLGGVPMVERTLRRTNMRVVPTLVSNSFGLMEAYCRRNLAISFQIAVAAQRAELAGHLKAVEIDDPALSADLALCQRKGRRLPLAAAAFVEQARERIVSMNAG